MKTYQIQTTFDGKFLVTDVPDNPIVAPTVSVPFQTKDAAENYIRELKEQDQFVPQTWKY